MPAFDSSYLARLAGDSPGWRRDRMQAAHHVFESLDEPTGAEEDWRYVEFEHRFSDLSPVTEPGRSLGESPYLAALESRSGYAAIIDGYVLEAASDEASVQSFADLEEDPHIGGVVPVDHNKLTAAHAAFSAGGLLVDVPPGMAMTAPLLIEVQAVTANTATFPHIVIRTGESSEAGVVVVYRSSPGDSLLQVPEVDISVGDGSNLRFLSVQGVDPAATTVVHQRVAIGRDATSRVGDVGLGGKLGRLDLGINLFGDGASSEAVGLYFGEGEQTLDYRVVVDHFGKRTSSDVFLKGAVEDDAQSVFTGLLRIEKEAQRTSTFETNRNLVLSENAKAQSVPNLEILCDDVMCGHASSVGPLEEEPLYYLQSRGLSRPRAERLLVRGFFQEVIDRLPVAGLATTVSNEVFGRFVTAQEEGRVK